MVETATWAQAEAAKTGLQAAARTAAAAAILPPEDSVPKAAVEKETAEMVVGAEAATVVE